MAIDFNISDIFGSKEDLEYKYDEKNSQVYRDILCKLLNAEEVSNEELEYVCNFKYEVSSKEELKKIIETYSKKNPSFSLNWIDTFRITDMSELFKYSKYNGDISEWNVSNVANMASMFAYSKFNGDISEWNVSNVANMACMFAESQFNGDISGWDVSRVDNMAGMFAYSKFNHDISSWKVSNEKLKDYMWGKL